jgi:hypothetical protein
VLHVPLIHCLVQSEEDKVEALKYCTFLNLPTKEEGDRVGECMECAGEHQLVLARIAEDVVVYIERLLHNGKLTIVKNDIRCMYAVPELSEINAIFLLFFFDACACYAHPGFLVFDQRPFSNVRWSLSVASDFEGGGGAPALPVIRPSVFG